MGLTERERIREKKEDIIEKRKLNYQKLRKQKITLCIAFNLLTVSNPH